MHFCFHRNQCKMQIMGSYAVQFSKPISYIHWEGSFFYCMLISLFKMFFSGVQKQKVNLFSGKLTFFMSCKIVSSVGQNRSIVDFNNSSCNWMML